jgi:hypothetical protein
MLTARQMRLWPSIRFIVRSARARVERQEEYRLRFRLPSDDEFISQIRQATSGSWPVGPDR